MEVFLFEIVIIHYHEEDEIIIDKLYEAGCSDATIGMGNPELIAFSFSREAGSLKDALVSAISDIRKVFPFAQLAEITT